MPKIKDFKAENGEIIKINYSASRGMFYAQYRGQDYEEQILSDLEIKLIQMTKWVYDWKPVIEIEIEFSHYFERENISLKYERYWVSKYFKTWHMSNWESYIPASQCEGVEDRDSRDSGARPWFDWVNELPNHKEGKHIIEYNQNIWENLNEIRRLMKKLGENLDFLFSDENSLKRLSENLIKALPAPSAEQNNHTGDIAPSSKVEEVKGD
jgi:hypothetical protein